MRLHAQLENTLKIRINSNDEIIPALKKLSEMGKFDKPKELAMFAIILDRIGKLEDEATIQASLKENKTNTVIEKLAGFDPLPEDGINTDIVGETSGNPPPNAVVAENTETIQPATTPEQPVSEDSAQPATEEDTTGTVSEFTPENITDTSTDDPANPS